MAEKTAKEVLHELRGVLEVPENANIVDHASKIMGKLILTDDWKYWCGRHNEFFTVSYEERKKAEAESRVYLIGCLKCLKYEN